jgi:D-alanine-D-alanine ligase
MIIALTYDLRDDYLAEGFSAEESAEFDSKETIIAIETTLISLGFTVERLGNIKALVKALAAEQHKNWDIVFNICEGVTGIGRESQVPCLLEAYNIPYVFSTPEVMALTMDKAITKQILQNAEINTPPFMVVKTMTDLSKFNQYHLKFPLFAKPIAEGTGKGIDTHSKIATLTELNERCSYLLEKYKQPVLVEQYLAGRDLTVGIVGNGDNAKALAVLETIYKDNAQSRNQTFYNKENCEQVLEYVITNDATAQKAAEIALKCWQVLGCRDAGRIDFRCDENDNPYFLEINPLAGLHPTHSDLPILATQAGIAYKELIKQIIDSALTRNNLLSNSHSKVA